MRYSTVFKFIALVLCAASLVGMVGSAAGILCLTELGGKSVQEHYMDRLRSTAISYGMNAAAVHASEELGGAPQSLVDSQYRNWEYLYFDWTRVGYTLYDNEGNAIREKAMPDDSRGVEYAFDKLLVGGQYMKVLSTTPHREYYSEAGNGPAEERGSRIAVMPAQGSSAVYSVLVDYTDGSRQEWTYDGTQLGALVYEGGTDLIFRSNIGDLPMGDGWYPNHILFADRGGNILYEAYDEALVVLGSSYEDGMMQWLLPAGTVTAAAPVGITHTDGDYTAYDAIPAQGATVTAMNVTYSDPQGEALGSEGISSPDLIGTLYHDYQGNAKFRSTEPMTMDIPEGSIISAITFVDGQGNLVFEAACPSGVGTVEYDEIGCMVFRGRMPGTVIPEETTVDAEISYGFVNASGQQATIRRETHLYSAPGQDAQVLGTLEAGAVVTVQKQMGELVGDGIWGLTQKGWISMADAELAEAVADGSAVIAGDTTELYSSPDGGTVIGTLEAGQQVDILLRETVNDEEWGLSTAGWLRMAQVSFAAEASPASAERVRQAEAAPAATEVTEYVTEPEAEETVSATEPPEEATAAPTEPVPYPAANVEVADYYDSEQQTQMVAEYVWEAIPEGYYLSIQLAPGALESEFEWTLLRIADVFRSRSILLEILGVCIAIFALCVVHLCCSAGRTRRNNEVRAGGLNRIPLDLYLAGGGFGVVGLLALAWQGAQYFAKNDEQLAVIMFGSCVYLAALLLVGFFFACVAQFKTPGGFWWRNTLCGWSIRLMIRGCSAVTDLGIKSWVHGKPAAGKLLRWLGHCCRALWDTAGRLLLWAGTMFGKGFRWSAGHLARFFGLLPITWQFLTTGFALVFLMYAMIRTYKVGYILLGFGIFFAVILYAATAFAILLESAKRMSRGDLDTKVDDRMLIGGFKEFAGRLNDLAGVAVIAAQKQLKSERMKTELITNVSHDIKTPLTSIINYVDLLQKPHTEAEQTQYLEVLDRQSQRLKKLIDDLMDMSKASTGNMPVDIQRMDAGETVNQVLGEFGDKLDRAQLIPVFRQPEEQVYMMADGRLVWRVMSNLLGNAVKYALPGTRIYLDLLEMDGKVIISMKNISREELNVNADELMERFVRGDASRNTEGSGLGLNIAQSLMELQKGQLQILVDGDLFKVTLIFPAA